MKKLPSKSNCCKVFMLRRSFNPKNSNGKLFEDICSKCDSIRHTVVETDMISRCCREIVHRDFTYSKDGVSIYADFCSKCKKQIPI